MGWNESLGIERYPLDSPALYSPGLQELAEVPGGAPRKTGASGNFLSDVIGSTKFLIVDDATKALPDRCGANFSRYFGLSLTGGTVGGTLLLGELGTGAGFLLGFAAPIVDCMYQ